MVDFIKALKRPFSDTNKLLIGTLLGMIPILNLAVVGYTLLCSGFTKEKVKRNKLPEWENYGDLFMKGIVSFVIGFLLFLPALLVFIWTFGAVFMSSTIGTMLGGISPDTWNQLATGQITEIQIEQWFNQNWTQLMPIIIGALPIVIVGVVLAFFAFYMAPIAILGWLKEKRFGAAFEWKILKKATTLDYFVNWIVVAFLTSIVNILLGWIPFLGMGITTYVIGVFSYTVYAEVYERV